MCCFYSRFNLFYYSSRTTITNLPTKETEDESEDDQLMEIEVLDESLNYSGENEYRPDSESEEQGLTNTNDASQGSEIEESLSDLRNEGYQTDGNYWSDDSDKFETPIPITKRALVKEKATPRIDNQTPKRIHEKVSVLKENVNPQPSSSKKNKNKSLDMDNEFSETLGTFNTYLRTKTTDRNASQEYIFANIGFAKLVDTLMQNIDSKEFRKTEKQILDLIYEKLV